MWLIVRQQPMKAGWWDAPLMIQDLAEAISITRNRISYSLIKLQPLLCIPACGYKFYALVLHPKPIPTSSLILKRKPVGDLFWSFFAETVSGRWLFLQRSSIVDVWRNSKCEETIICLKRRFPSLELHRGILNSSCVLILLIHTKNKYKKMKSWTDPTLSFP